ncbi:MAG: multidrug effflux MFS transporter [Gammaproteobacteria bacterium]|nr:multidrug effflux MFS transporter [Gammaproteobacteria bacterium]
MTSSSVSPGIRLIILLASLNALVAAAIDMYLPAFPAIGISLGIEAGQVQQTLTVFLIGLAVGQGFYGPLLDRYGRRRPLLIGVLLFTLGSALAALAQSFELLLVARFIQALGAAAGSVTPRAIIADTCDVGTAARAFSMLMQVMMLAPITAPIIGGAMLLIGPWQLIFWALVAAGTLAGLASLRMLPETLPPEKRLPISVHSIVRNYLKLLGHPRFLLYTLASGFMVAGLFTYISNSPFVFIEHFGLTPGQYSLIFGASASGMILTGQINLRLLRFYKPLQVLYLGLSGFVGTALLLGLLVLTGTAQAWSYALLLGLCLSMLGMISGNQTAITMSYARQFAGIASSLMGMLQFLLAGLLSFLVNLMPTSLATLPTALAGFGAVAVALCVLARQMPTRD